LFYLLDSNEKGVPVVDINQYNVNTSSAPNAEGFFKHVFFMADEPNKVVQTFRRMTITQRTTEIVGLLALKGLPHMGQITEVLKESHGEIIGLCMQRYEKTLKQYTHAHSHHRLTAYQKMDLVIQMLQCIETIHKVGLAHRDLSEVNFMVNTTQEKLRDGSPKAHLFLIDFGKSTFTDSENYRRWWVEQPCLTLQQEYDGEIVPKTIEELDVWCKQLPWVRSKPDHGYRLYRSIQTLPKSRVDTDDLPWMVNPLAEDLYSIGTIIWKTFSETEPWYGILDTDLKGLRETVGEDYHIERALEREVHGKLSRELLFKFLKTSPEQRQSATKVLDWIQDINVQNGLIAEWEQHAPVRRQKRHAKALFRYDDEQAAEMEQAPHRKKLKVNVKQMLMRQ
jgi:serine/threonine protein kinase